MAVVTTHEKLYNYMEDIVEKNVDDQLKKSGFCDCEQCRLDVIALALNNLKPHYVVSDKGQLYAKLDSFEVQAIVDVTAEIAAAAQKVSRKPRH